MSVLEDLSRGLHSADGTAGRATGVDGALLAFEGIWRYWGRGDRRWPVLQDVTLRCAPGSAVCVAGGNGAGKTTLLRIASGLLSPNSGVVTVQGIAPETDWREYHRGIGFLSAGDRGLYARLTVRDHLQYWATLAFVPRRERRERVADAIEAFDLGDLAGRRADRLSQGQRQRLRLALAFVHRPLVVLLDEPRNSLDAGGVDLLTAAVGRTLTRGGTVLWVCPAGEDQPMAFDQVYELHQGSLVRC